MYRFHDVMSTEEWALEMIPQPALAVVMLFPIKDAVSVVRAPHPTLVTADSTPAIAPWRA